MLSIYLCAGAAMFMRAMREPYFITDYFSIFSIISYALSIADARAIY